MISNLSTFIVTSKNHSGSGCADGIFAFQLMFSCGQHSKRADLLNSYLFLFHSFFIRIGIFVGLAERFLLCRLFLALINSNRVTYIGRCSASHDIRQRQQLLRSHITFSYIDLVVIRNKQRFLLRRCTRTAEFFRQRSKLILHPVDLFFIVCRDLVGDDRPALRYRRSSELLSFSG